MNRPHPAIATAGRPPAPAGGRGSARPRWRVLAGLAGGTVLLHALLLAAVASAGAQADGGMAPALPAMQVRTLPVPDAPAAEVVVDPAAAVTATTAPAAAVERTPAHPARRTQPPRPTAPPVDAIAAAVDDAGVAVFDDPRAAVVTPVAAVVAAADAIANEPAAVPAPAAAARHQDVADAPPASPTHGNGPVGHGDAAPSRDDEMPIYKTVFPPPLTLHYDLRRGLLGGTGSLVWRPDGDRYEARLEGRVAGLNVMTQVSQGGFDDAGLAPRRYTDQRMNRDTRAANFQREHGKITFSGPADEFPLLIGTQDRLSWMIQLAAVVSAEPRRLAPGGKVALYVVGARADAAMWVFRSGGAETVDTPGGPVRAVRFTREAHGPHDTLAEAWLDPARHGLPVRARIGTGDGGDAVELTLRDLQTP